MKSVAEVWGKPVQRRGIFVKYKEYDWPLPDDLVGIEVEVENFRNNNRLPSRVEQYWQQTRDGSLRSGVEYVLSRPLAGKELSKAIHVLFSEDTKLEKALTSSTHVHMDMREEDTPVGSLQSLVILMYVIEPAVFAYADPSREWCGFTNGLDTAPESFISGLMSDQAMEDTTYMVQLPTEARSRYFGLNLQALMDHGSVEFRYFPTATTPEQLAEWVMLVQSCKKAAVAYPSRDAMLSVLNNYDAYHQFIASFFGQWADAFNAVLPYSKVERRLKSLMATYSTRDIAPADSGFDIDNVYNNPRYSRLLKNKTANSEYSDVEFFQTHPNNGYWVRVGEVGVYMAIPSGCIPSTHTTTSILFARGNIYIKHGFGPWEQLIRAFDQDGIMTLPEDVDAIRAELVHAARALLWKMRRDFNAQASLEMRSLINTLLPVVEEEEPSIVLDDNINWIGGPYRAHNLFQVPTEPLEGETE